MMDGLITQLVKLLNKNVVVHIYSHPYFAIETIAALVLCVGHYLLISEINNLYRRTNAKAAVKPRQKHRKLNTASNFGLVIPTIHEESRLVMRYCHGYKEKVDHLLSISPTCERTKRRSTGKLG
ncbi:hypothetical protein JTB14_007519 [Gonioctena quinquepunctata]|nr:hypothetical protein JTB14_007519 [Gonioctena quinquepunctata]